MHISRRSILTLVGATVGATTGAAILSPQAFAAGSPADPFGQRSIGSPKAPVTAVEYFSMTCTHCAYFGTTVMPKLKQKLVDTGKLQVIYKDFPLDGVALMAAQVSRYLPADEYYPFIETLFASQSDWAFTPGIDYKAAIFKYAALAGMDRSSFDAALADDKLKSQILQGQQEAETMYHINATPSFIINGKLHTGAMEYDDFASAIAAAAKG